MTRTIPHRELRNNSSAILREVQRGETFTITNNGEPVAVLSPVQPDRLAGVRYRAPLSDKPFSDIKGVKVDRPSLEILDELRGDR